MAYQITIQSPSQRSAHLPIVLVTHYRSPPAAFLQVVFAPQYTIQSAAVTAATTAANVKQIARVLPLHTAEFAEQPATLQSAAAVLTTQQQPGFSFQVV